MLPPTTCTPPSILTPRPRILVVVPGHGEPSRSHVTMSNLARIRRMDVDTTCLMYAYGHKLTDALAAERFPGCRVVMRQQGLWMHHLRRVPASDVAAHQYVLLMIDGVEMNADVDLQMLVHIMEANCLSVGGPACGSRASRTSVSNFYSPSHALCSAII